jgi:alpha-tubulin suppressor-like RCC1 family protein
MRGRPLLTIGLCLLLSGCGTLRIDIDYGGTTAAPETQAASPAAEEAATAASQAAQTAVSVTGTPTAADTPEPTPGREAFASIAAGRDFTCAVTTAGRIYCWGNNNHGQLGNGTRINSSLPVAVEGISDAASVAAGWGHACALTAAGAVMCWGYNEHGELGNGKNIDQVRPVTASGMDAGNLAVAAGEYHTCAVTGSNGLKCWGRNTYGQLGDWTKDDSSVPVVSPFFGGGVAAVTAGFGHTCVQTTEGWAKCWGNNAYGQMGFAKGTDIHLPAEDVVGLSGRVLELSAAGNLTCALTAGGGVQCWGDNRYGQLGDGSVQKRYQPVPVVGLAAEVETLAVGWNHACVVAAGGELRCWGWNFYGQLGDGTTANRPTPTRVAFLTDGVRDIAAGWGHTCVATVTGWVKCWGLNGSGQLGDGTWTDSKVPLSVVAE